MRTTRFSVSVCVVALALASPVFAKDKVKGSGAATKGDGEKTTAKAATTATPAASREPWLEAKVTFSPSEREIIRGYVHSCTVTEGPVKNPKSLPPGLAKKVGRGGNLPPGWQKKCVRGQVMPAEVYRHCHPLPAEVVVKLPPPPPGTVLVAINGKVVRLAKATLEILDVFEVL